MNVDIRTFQKIAGLCGIFAPIIAYVFIFISIANAPWFTWQHNALSDLGAHTGSDITFNFGLMTAGLLELIFSIGLLLHFKDILSRLGSVFLVVDSIALFAIGYFPETAGIIHYYVSVVFFVMFPLGYLIFTVALFKNSNDRLPCIVALIAAIASIIIWSTPWTSFGITGVAIPEFLSSLFGASWVVLMGWYLYKEKQ